MEGHKAKLIRSLRFKLCVVLALVGILYTALSCFRTYHNSMRAVSVYVDEELAQIAGVIINYDVLLPKSWERPQRRPIFQGRLGHMFFQEPNLFERQMFPVPSLSDLFDKHQEIIIAPLYAQPGEVFYFPAGVLDGYYTVLINDKRVRAYVATNKHGTRFVVARPYILIEALVNRALTISFFEFIFLIIIYIPLSIIFVNIIFIPVRRLAKELDNRKESDLTPIKGKSLPSELDVFIDSINRLFGKTQNALLNERRFIADAAHELRTPLTAISLQAQAIDEKQLPDAESLKMQQLKQAISKQRKLTNDLLNYARTQCGREIKITQFKVKDLFIEVIDELGSVADKKDIDLGVVGDSNIVIYTDRDSLKTIVRNLVSNALKYTPQGGVCDLSCETTSKYTLIKVADNGPGIDNDDLEKVFNAFYRVGGDTAKIEGTGLGLAIVKSTCDEIGAKIKLSNKREGGLLATVSLKNSSKK